MPLGMANSPLGILGLASGGDNSRVSGHMLPEEVQVVSQVPVGHGTAAARAHSS